jgi:hypothetical protein
MRYLLLLTLLLTVNACTITKAKESTKPVEVPKPIAVQVGKDWQVVEEPPQLQNERNNQLPFQTEQSIQPEGAGAPPQEDKRKLETPR